MDEMLEKGGLFVQKRKRTSTSSSSSSSVSASSASSSSSSSSASSASSSSAQPRKQSGFGPQLSLIWSLRTRRRRKRILSRYCTAARCAAGCATVAGHQEARPRAQSRSGSLEQRGDWVNRRDPGIYTERQQKYNRDTGSRSRPDSNRLIRNATVPCVQGASVIRRMVCRTTLGVNSTLAPIAAVWV